MQYNGEANNQDICSLADLKAKSNPSSFPISKKTLYANEGERIIWSFIMEAYGGWSFDDNNNTDLPEATTVINASETFVPLPIDSAHILGISYKDQSGTWHPLKPITLEQIQDRGRSESEFMNVPGTPEYYRPVANGFKPYPAANFTQAASWGIWITRDISAFAVTDTTKKPGFDSEFHEGLALYMALQHCKINTLPQATSLQTDWDGNEDLTGREGGFKLRIKSYYGNKFRQLFPPRFRQRDSVRDYM